jgi:outer membrane receptor protein involved in Fe transport
MHIRKPGEELTMKHNAHHRPTPRLLACALAAALTIGAPVAFAQSTSATLRGQANASARVTATNVATGLARSMQADANGNYTIGGLPPGTYRVQVEGGPMRMVTVGVGQNVYLDVVPSELETIEVVGTPTETRTSEVSTYVTPREISALPQDSRNFLSFADTVPGMIFDTKGDGSTQLRSGAQNSNGTNVFIDGVGQKNYVLKGGISGQDSSRGNPFPQLGIGEYKVITSNYKAEYDQISSAAVTAVTKSGTNEFEGSVFWDRTSDHWRSMTPVEERAGRESDTQTEQYGMSLGGPIMKDRLFFFLTYEGKTIDSPRSVSAGGNWVDPLPPELTSQTGPVASPFSEDLWFGKLTWQPTGDHLIELSMKRRDESELTNIADRNTPSYGTSKDNESTRVDLRWQFNRENWLNDAHVTYEDDSFNPRPITFGPGFNLVRSDQLGRATVLNYGGGRDFQDKGQKGWSLQDDFTWFGLENHTMKAGFKYKSVEINAFEQQPYNPQYQIDLDEQLALGRDSTNEYVPYQVQFGALVPGAATRNITTDAKQFGIYFQDDWQVTEKLLLNLGLRWDYEQNPAWEDYVTPIGIANALRAWPNIHQPGVGYNIEDYISNGSNRDAFKDAWQPRLGFSYDLNADQRHVIFGGAGRAYDRNLWDYLQLEQSKSTFPSYTFFFNTPDHPCTVGVNNCVGDFNPGFYDPAVLAGLVANSPFLGAEVNLINNDLKVPYADQFSLGMRNAFGLWGHDWTLSTTLVHIRKHDDIVFYLGNRFPDGSFHDPAFPGATWGRLPFGNPIPGYGTLIIADNGIETRLNQFLLGLEKNYSSDSPWSLSVAYTYSDAEENRPSAANSDEHYSIDYPDLAFQPFQESVGIPRNRLVVSGFVDVIWDMTFSGKFTIASALPKDFINCRDAISNDNCFFDVFKPEADNGFKQVDVALRKEFNTGTDLKPWVRVDVFNLFDWHNWNDFNTFAGNPGVPNPDFGSLASYNITLPTRTFKLSVGFDF